MEEAAASRLCRCAATSSQSRSPCLQKPPIKSEVAAVRAPSISRSITGWAESEPAACSIPHHSRHRLWPVLVCARSGIQWFLKVAGVTLHKTETHTVADRRTYDRSCDTQVSKIAYSRTFRMARSCCIPSGVMYASRCRNALTRHVGFLLPCPSFLRPSSLHPVSSAHQVQRCTSERRVPSLLISSVFKSTPHVVRIFVKRQLS